MLIFDSVETRKYIGMNLKEVMSHFNEYEKGHIDEYGDFLVYVPSFMSTDLVFEFEKGICVRAFANATLC